MVRTPVESSNLAAIAYDPESAVLEVEFQNGGIYQYFGVPLFVYQDLCSAASKGRYFNENVKKAGYPVSKIG
jgi:hypothetical protein